MTDQKALRPLLDADTFMYACGFAADAQMRGKIALEYPDATEEEREQIRANSDYVHWALSNVKTVINDIQELFDGENVRLFLTGSGNYREYLASIQQYKGNRDPTHKPKYYREIKDYLVDVWHAEIVNGREADDALGVAQFQAEPETTVIVSIDKDLDNVWGWHYNWRKKELYFIDPERADYLFWMQVLQGDKTDHIQGIPGIGPKKAEKILAVTDFSWMAMADATLTAYEQAGLGWDQMYENATLLWIQRQDNINWDDTPIVTDNPPWEAQ